MLFSKKSTRERQFKGSLMFEFIKSCLLVFFFKLRINKKTPSKVGEFFTSSLGNIVERDFTQA